MEIFKIKISPEVLKNDLSPESYSGVSFGYYSGMSYVLSGGGTTNLGLWALGLGGSAAGAIGNGILGPNSTSIFINSKDYALYNWGNFLLKVRIGSLINIIMDTGQIYQYITTGPASLIPPFTIQLPIQSVNVTSNIPLGGEIQLTITQPGTSLLTDLSIPVLLKQNFEDIGYYSPFDGDISQCESDINFLLVSGTTSPNEICLYNTTPPKTFLQNMYFEVNWGDGSNTQSVGGSICHTYLVPGTYQIKFSGSNDFGQFLQIKNITVPYTVLPYLNPQGIVNFSLNSGSWSSIPSSYVYNYFFDANNTISAQLSSNFTTVPFLVSGQTISRLNELRQYGPNPFVIGRTVILENGTTGVTNSQSDQFTAYTINDVLYLDLSGGSSFFYSYSYGLTSYNMVASATTKFEYLMNVIGQPEIQSNVFIERGKTSGVESFRRIGEISNTGDLTSYGYGYFDVRNFDDI